jgi:hypothetical protein
MLIPVAGWAFGMDFANRESQGMSWATSFGYSYLIMLSGIFLARRLRLTTLPGVEDLSFDSEAPITRPVSYTICFRVSNII